MDSTDLCNEPLLLLQRPGILYKQIEPLQVLLTAHSRTAVRPLLLQVAALLLCGDSAEGCDHEH